MTRPGIALSSVPHTLPDGRSDQESLRLLLAESGRMLVCWLMTYSGDDESRIRQILGMAGLTIDKPTRVLAVSVGDHQTRDPRPTTKEPRLVPQPRAGEEADYCLASLSTLWGTDFCSQVNGRLYVFRSIQGRRPGNGLEEIQEIARSGWSSLGHRGCLRIGIGGLATSGTGLKRSLDEADTCLALLERNSAKRANVLEVLPAEQAQIYTLLGLIKEHQELRSFVSRLIGPLVEYDQLRGTDFVATLEIYLECGGSLREAARRLCLHPHGVRYRLNRIFELLHVDDPSPQWRLNAYLAVKASKLLDK